MILTSFIFPKVSEIANFNNRTNILVMGVGGKDHEGGDLTDTMMLVSISLNNPSVSITAISRDIWMPDIRAKINSAYHYGGIEMAKKEVEEIVGVPINYTALIDFSGFKDVVDAIGGVKINVEHDFVDRLYPIAGREDDACLSCRYETVEFKKGVQTMDGETALKFVRSRHAEGLEGTDTARESRQQKVIEAIKGTVLSPSTFLNPQKDLKIWNVVKQSVDTDIDSKSAAILTRRVFDSKNSIKNYLIPESLLVNPPISKTYDNQYVFIPKLGNGKWEEINKWILESPLSPSK